MSSSDIVSKAEARQHKLRLARVGDEEAIANVHIKSLRATYGDRLSQRALSDLSVDEHAGAMRASFGRLSEGYFTVVAEDDAERIVGYGSAGHQSSDPPDSLFFPKFPGEIYTLYVDPQHQGIGVGRLLFGALARGLLRVGHGSANLWTPRGDTPAAAFYESMGGKRSWRWKHIGARPIRLLCRCYEWRDLRSVAGDPNSEC